jgi:phage terminase large subunit-like protein
MKTLTSRLARFARYLKNDVKKLEGITATEATARVVCLALLLVPAAVAVVVFDVQL